MILSYHPFFVADKNLLCAGRTPDSEDLAAIRAADAVVLPQGCCADLYAMTDQNCAYVFPNFNRRFRYPGKLGQAQLFAEMQVPHPQTETFGNLNEFYKQYGKTIKNVSIEYPLVFKFDWGGEGYHVHLITSPAALGNALKTAEKFERSGHKGFLLQEYISAGNRSLRVVVIGQTYISYWRIQNKPGNIRTSLARGAALDLDSDPGLQQNAISAVKKFCRRTGINLAGFDLLFASESKHQEPLFLEINYYFGRRGLGGSERFYQLLEGEILKWIDTVGLSLGNI